MVLCLPLQVVGGEDGVVGQVFETVFALMSAISPAYIGRFSSCLAAKLSRLATNDKEEPVVHTNGTPEHQR